MPIDETDPWSPAQHYTYPSPQRPAPRDPDVGVADERARWNVGDLSADVPNDPWWVIPADVTAWSEPDPAVGASSDLGESLYPTDDTITDISRELKIGELLAHVAPCTDGQRARCHELLSASGIGHLRRMIPWLRERTWSGTKLQLFLEFRGYWESSGNRHWWETFYWSERDHCWVPHYAKTTLTFDHARELVERRQLYSPAEVIDQCWFDDWEDCAVWEVGIQSFASFAVFRAGVPHGKYWRTLLLRQDQRTALEVEQCVDSTYAPFMLPSLISQFECHPWPHTGADPWPEVTERAYRHAAGSGGNLARSWREIIARMTCY